MTKEIENSVKKQPQGSQDQDDCFSFEGSSPLSKNIASEADIQQELQDYNAENNRNLKCLGSPSPDQYLGQNRPSPNFVLNLEEKQNLIIQRLPEPQRKAENCCMKLVFDDRVDGRPHYENLVHMPPEMNLDQPLLERGETDNQMREKLQIELESTIQSSLLSIHNQVFETQQVLMHSQEKQKNFDSLVDLVSPSQVVWDEKLNDFYGYIANSASRMLIETKPFQTPGKLSVGKPIQALNRVGTENLQTMFNRPTQPVGAGNSSLTKQSVGQFSTGSSINPLIHQDIINRPQCSTVSKIMPSTSQINTTISQLNNSLFKVSAMSQDIKKPQSVGKIIPPKSTIHNNSSTMIGFNQKK